jgi:saccharopine dehydrogenase-like NADP-dependent oxidoreductase
LALKPQNIVFALVRSKANSQKIAGLGAKNVHVLEADITDVKALKVISGNNCQP